MMHPPRGPFGERDCPLPESGTLGAIYTCPCGQRYYYRTFYAVPMLRRQDMLWAALPDRVVHFPAITG